MNTATRRSPVSHGGGQGSELARAGRRGNPPPAEGVRRLELSGKAETRARACTLPRKTGCCAKRCRGCW